MLFVGLAISGRPRQLLRRVTLACRAIRQLRLEVVHPYWRSLLAGATTCAIVGARVPLKVSYRGDDINDEPVKPKWRNLVQIAGTQVSVMFTYTIVCVSDELRGRLWFSRHQVEMNSVLADLNTFQRNDRRYIRCQLRTGFDERVVILYAGGRQDTKRRELADSGVVRKAARTVRRSQT